MIQYGVVDVGMWVDSKTLFYHNFEAREMLQLGTDPNIIYSP